MRAGIVPGAVFPACGLSDHRGGRCTLSELQGEWSLEGAITPFLRVTLDISGPSQT